MKETISMPRVSVVMCTYNGEQFLTEQIESILNQTYPIYELIIQDDSSTDRTWEIIQEYAKKCSLIKSFRNDTNQGFNHNFKQAILRAEGELIAIADQDDIWYPEKIEKQVQKIDGADVCISAYHGGENYPPTNENRVTLPFYQLEYLLFYDCTPGHSMLIKKDFAHHIFRAWDGHILYDWWISVNAHLYHGITCVEEPLNWHRPHNASAITKLNAQYAPYLVKKPTWQPYIIGFRKYRALQKLDTWQFFYRYIHKHADPVKQHLAYQLSELLFRRDLFSLLRLCLLCMRHKDTVYFNPNQKGFMSYIRSFCYPMIRAYGNTYFYL